MAEQKKKGKNVQKQFFEMKVPLTSSKVVLYGSSVEALDGSYVKLDLTRALRGKNLELGIRARTIDGELHGNPESLSLLGSYIRRVMRTGVNYVEDSFNAKCKDCELIVKPFLITRNKVSRALRNALRKEAKEYLTSYLTLRTKLEIFSDIMSNKVQKELSLKLKKLYPLALCEIRILKIVPEKKQIS